ncbi:MAG: hypothetical protein ACLPWS_20025 [Rhodomicrobium sp.]
MKLTHLIAAAAALFGLVLMGETASAASVAHSVSLVDSSIVLVGHSGGGGGGKSFGGFSKPGGSFYGKPGGMWSYGKPGAWKSGKPGAWKSGKPGAWKNKNPGTWKSGSGKYHHYHRVPKGARWGWRNGRRGYWYGGAWFWWDGYYYGGSCYWNCVNSGMGPSYCGTYSGDYCY